MKDIFNMLFVGYILFMEGLGYCLIGMIAQIIFSYSIEPKQIEKVATMVFFTQGIVAIIAYINYKSIKDTYYNSNIYNLIFFVAILMLIGFFIYRSIDGKMNLTKWIVLIIGYLINIMIMIFIFSSFGKNISSFLLG